MDTIYLQKLFLVKNKNNYGSKENKFLKY